jgi:hypothetical protein
MDISNATRGAFMILYRTENLGTAFTNIVQHSGPRTLVLPFGPCLSGRISVPKSQDIVNEADAKGGGRLSRHRAVWCDRALPRQKCRVHPDQ